MAHRFLFALLLLVWTPAMAATPTPEERRLLEALGMSDVLEVMRAEGLDYAGELETQFFPGSGGAAWEATVSGIYATGAMREIFITDFAGRLEPATVEKALDFFESDLGERVITLEVSARSALLDPEVEDESKALLEDLIAADGPRIGRLRAFVDANDLVESNVVGALNANYAFYVALNEGDAFPYAMSEEEMLADVWSQEPEIRRDTEEWIYSYLALAYRPLTGGELDAYIAFSESDVGRRYNRALFEAFDTMFTAISRRLGASVARFMSGQKI